MRPSAIRAARDAAIARITTELDRISVARTRAREQARTRRAAKDMSPAGRRRAEQAAERDEAAHVKAECALREHPALSRWLRQTPSGRLQLDRAKIAAEAKLDGSTCSRPQTPICRPRTSRWATRTCSKPNAASAT
jgi:hypothetical protein